MFDSILEFLRSYFMFMVDNPVLWFIYTFIFLFPFVFVIGLFRLPSQIKKAIDKELKRDDTDK